MEIDFNKQISKPSIHNLLKNSYIPISGAAFLCLVVPQSPVCLIGLIVSFTIICYCVSRIESFKHFINCDSVLLKVCTLLSSAGICWSYQKIFYNTWSTSSKLSIIKKMLQFESDLSLIISVFGALIAFIFVYSYLMTVYKIIIGYLHKWNIINKLTCLEKILYICLFALCCVVMSVVFSRTVAFYGSPNNFNLIYTSDTNYIVRKNAYLNIYQSQNDIKQPLFAVFAMPFLGISSLIINLFNLNSTWSAVLMNIPQIALLIISSILVSELMQLPSASRICYIILSFSTYTFILAVFMMEQYIISVFWLLLLMTYISKSGQSNRILLWAAGGSMVTSLICMCYTSHGINRTDCSNWIKRVFASFLGFGILMLAFGRLDIFYDLAESVTVFSAYTGKDVSFSSRLFQYTSFIKDCFIAPEAALNLTFEDYPTWQMLPKTHIDIMGSVLFLIAGITSITDKSRACRIAGLWVLFSVCMLLLFGWGTSENGLILYSLYFSWAFFVLIFKCILKVCEKMNLSGLAIPFSIICCIVMLCNNVPEIIKMIKYAIDYYPA